MAQNEEVQTIKAAAKKATAPTDSVLAVSRHPDGTPAQSSGFTSVDPETTAAISERQLGEQAVSAVDHAIRSAQAADVAADEVPEDDITKALREAHEGALKNGVDSAKSEKVGR